MSMTLVYGALMFVVFWAGMVAVVWDDNRRCEDVTSLPSAIGWGTLFALGGAGVVAFAVTK